MAPAGDPFVMKAAFDPVAIFIVLVIIVNVISAFRKRARQLAQQPSAAPLPRPVAVAPTVPAAATVARAAQRARLQQATKAAQGRLAQQLQARAPVSVTTTPPPAPPPPALAPLMELAPLPSFEYAADALTPKLVTAQRTTATTPRPLTLVGGKFSGADLFVAAAIVGPPAALRQTGHTPAGW